MQNLTTLPNGPGCYLFKNINNKIIYIGKAKNIKKRVKTYFQKTTLDPKTQVLVENISKIDYILTDNEVESLILENNLIKKHQPKYNIDLKDAKSFAYIQLTNEEYPRLLLARKKIVSGKFYGPFVSAKERDSVLHFLRRTFMIRTCKKMPKKTCLRYHIQLCEGPCEQHITKEHYLGNIKKTKMILNGKTGPLLKKLDQEMKQYSKKQEYEKAQIRKNQKEAITHLKERQNMQREQKYNEDIINYQQHNDQIYLMMFNIYKGTLTNKNEYVFNYNDDFFEEFLVQYYSENPVPKEIIIPYKTSDSIIDFLKEKRKTNVKLTIPNKGSKKQLLELVDKNIEITFFGDSSKVKELKKQLKLQETPNIIECFDISHLSGTSTVGSMVQYRNGRADKNNYRRFKIRSVEGIDDFKAIAEIVKRRYKRLVIENTDLPNLIIIDGGKGQLSTAIAELEKLNIKIPIISIAKQFEEIYMPGLSPPLHLSKKDNALKFIQEIRDEAHRFAIKYNRLLRSKEITS